MREGSEAAIGIGVGGGFEAFGGCLVDIAAGRVGFADIFAGVTGLRGSCSGCVDGVDNAAGSAVRAASWGTWLSGEP